MRINPAFLKEYVKSLDDALKGRYFSHPEFLTSSSLFFRVSGLYGQSLGIVIDQNNPRVYVSEAQLTNSLGENNFISHLKKELSNAFCNEIKIVNDDQIVCFVFSIINHVYKEETRLLFAELIPHHPNLILTDDSLHILDVFRPTSLLSNRPLAKNLIYEYPKKPESENDDNSELNIDTYCEFCISLEDELFQQRRKELFGDQIRSFKRKIASAEKKEKAIQNDIKKAESHLGDAELANLIYTYAEEIKPGQAELNIGEISVKLDPLLSYSENAQRYFKSEKRAKATIANAQENLDRVHHELDTLRSTLLLLEEGDGAQLQKWFSENSNHSKQSSKNVNRISSKDLPYRVTHEGTTFLFGKNANQNRYLTFFLTRSKHHLWLHIEGESGSHLFIKKDNPSQEDILLGCQIVLALNGRSDGVVQIAERGDLRQGSALGQVILKKYRVQRIDTVSPLARELIEKAVKY